MHSYSRYKILKVVIDKLFFFILAMIESVCFDNSSTDGMPFSEHLVFFLDMNMDYKYTSIFKVTSHMLPILYFSVTYGIDLYTDWSMEKVYSIVRYHSRVRIYFKRICVLFIKSLLFSVAYLFTLLLIYYFLTSDYHSYKIGYMIGMIAVYSAQLFSYSVLLSLVSMKFGTSYGFFVTVLYLLISIKTSLYMVEYHSSIADIFGTVSFSMGVIHSIKSEALSASIFLSNIIQVFISALTGYFIVTRRDIGFLDKEME